jgi:hypothetical protein
MTPYYFTRLQQFTIMNTLNIKNMKKNYIDLAKQKLRNHKTSGNQSNLSVFQVAALIDVITGRKEQNQIIDAFLFSHIGLN